MAHYIYRIKTGKDIYIGRTEDYKRRERDHKNNAKNENGEKYNTPVSKAIRENGFSFKLEVIAVVPKKRDAENIEAFFISTEATLNVQRFSKAPSKKTRTDKTKSKIAEARSKKVLAKAEDGEVHIFESVKVMAEQIGKARTTIQTRITEGTNKHGHTMEIGGKIYTLSYTK